jgi:transposase InsO family protein
MADNHLQQQFVVCETDGAWVADITYIKTYEGWLSLKTERVKRKVYTTRSHARADLFNYTEMFYNRTRLHSHLGYVSPDEYENTYSKAS